MKWRPRLIRLFLGVTFIFYAIGSVHCQSNKVTNTDSIEWVSKIDESYEASALLLTSMPSDQEVIKAIGCLLQLEGNKGLARFSGATGMHVSQLLPKATIELAALYYISYLYDGRWEHADGVALWNRNGEINPPGSIEKAYSAYNKWFKEVKMIGIANARNRHLDPLKDTNLYWYGN